MKKLLMGLGLVALLAGSANVFAVVKDWDVYNGWVQTIRFDKPMDAKNLTLIELCHLKRYTENNKIGLDTYINGLKSGPKKVLLSDFRSYLNQLIKGKDDYLGGLNGELITRIKSINANASCLK